MFWACDRSDCTATEMPVGRWVTRTAVSSLFTFCPPGPDERNTSNFKSFGLNLRFTITISGIPKMQKRVFAWSSKEK